MKDSASSQAVSHESLLCLACISHIVGNFLNTLCMVLQREKTKVVEGVIQSGRLMHNCNNIPE